jgi:hypothetical protein
LSTHPRRLSLNNPWARRHCWDQIWSLPGDLNRKFVHVPHCSITTTCLPTNPWKPQSLWLTTTWLSFPILPTLFTRLSPLWFRFVSRIENETEVTTFWNCVWHPKGITSGTRQH